MVAEERGRWARTGATGAPLVAIHTWWPTVELPHYESLSAALGDAPIVSLLAPDPEVVPMPRRVDEWVDHHEVTLRSIDVEPPLHLIGWSFGGVVTLELARRLRDRGVEVASVGLIDCVRPRLVPLSTSEFVWHHLGVAARLPEEERSAYVWRKVQFMAGRRFPRVGAMAKRALVSVGRRRPDERILASGSKARGPLVAAIHNSYLNYRGDPVDFPVDLYAAEETAERFREPVLGWLPWLQGGYRITSIPGGHTSMFERAQVEGLARAVEQSAVRSSGSDIEE